MSDFFILKNWKWISKSRWFWRYSTFCAIPWEFVFRKFTQILKLRGLRPYAWAYYSQNHPRCMSFYAGHFDMQNWGYLYDFTSTHAISTPVIFIFWSVFHSKPFFPSRPQGRHRYQKMWNFIAHLLIYIKSLSHHAPYWNAHAKVKNGIFDFSFPGNWFQLGLIGNDFSSSTIWAIQIQVPFAAFKNRKNTSKNFNTQPESIFRNHYLFFYQIVLFLRVYSFHQ